MFIKVSMVHCSHLVIFYFKEKFCVSACVREMFVLKLRPWLSKRVYLRYCLTQIFIQMVKYPFPDKRLVYQSFLNIKIAVSDSYAVICKDCNIHVLDPHLREHQICKIKLLPSAFNHFRNEVKLFALPRIDFFLFLKRKRSKIRITFCRLRFL